MEWLNYHHLFYFSVIAEEGGVAPASRKLRVTHSTLSAQLRALEEHFGAPLFERRGKRLVLTPFGADALAYAQDIFRLGRELNDVARGRATSTRGVVRVGVVSGMPKTLALHLLRPVLDDAGSTLMIRQDEGSRLLEALAASRLHVVLTNEAPSGAQTTGARLHVHPLGETDILFFATTKLARAREGFPDNLSRMPLILPPAGAPLRRRLDGWFARHRVTVRVKAEVDDAGLARALGAGGRGAFPVRAALRSEVEDLARLRLLGKCDDVTEPYYAVCTERRVRHAGVSAIIESARSELNASSASGKRSS